VRDLSWNLRAGEWPQIQRGGRRPYTDSARLLLSGFLPQATIWPGLDLLLPRTDEKLDALPSAYFRWEWESPGTKGLNFANFRALKRNWRLYSRRALLFPTTADSGSAGASWLAASHGVPLLRWGSSKSVVFPNKALHGNVSIGKGWETEYRGSVGFLCKVVAFFLLLSFRD